jgi:UDP-N-acetylmuramoyl-tripeptide--D-alanyl-D-alanine ligase
VRFSTSELAAQLGAELVGPDVFVEGASIDSRTTRPGQLFVPIGAERDGHDFVRSALRAGAPAYLTSGGPAGATAIIVTDTAGALMHLGRVARGRVANGVVGITGSVGKTTTKDLLHQCLATSLRTAASERSFNNELGLPLTLLNAPDDVQWVVLEMGARDVGHIARLAEVARPDVGIVTGVAMAHVEYFGDLDGVARAKGELVQALPATGVAVLNVDDPRVAAMAAASPCPVLGYAVTSAEADVRAGSVDLDGELRPSFLLTTPWGNGQVTLALRGAQQVPNALAAAAAALWCGVPFDGVVSALSSVTGPPLRMEVHYVPNGPVLIVDCYNANPASTEAALRSLAAFAGGTRLAILGLMAELGAETEAEHRRAALLAEELGIEIVGYQTDLYGGRQVAGPAEAVAVMLTAGPADALLVKGSRVARLEDVVRAYGSAAGVQSLVVGG